MSSVSTSPGGAKEMPAHLRKKKRTPSLASPHLGLPTPERAAKSLGFQADNLAAGDGPKVPRASERQPFTLPAQRDRITEEEIERAIRLKRAPDPMAKLTAVDRMLEEHEYAAIAWWVATHYAREAGRPARMRYDDTPRGLIEADDKVEQRWRLDLRAIDYVDERIHLAGRSVLDMIAWQIFPDLREGTPPSKIDVGRMIVKVQGKDRAEGGYEGYLRCLSQFISEARAEFAIEERRRIDRKAISRVAEKRRAAEALFR
jgi:hypothetical protein